MTDRRQCADDIAHHMLQECVCRNVQPEPVTLSLHGNTQDLAVGRCSLAARGAECGEIVSAQQPLRRLVHGINIERLIHPPRSVAVQRRSFQSIKDAVTIAAGRRRKSRMKLIIDGARPGYVNVVRKTAVSAKQPATFAAFAESIEVDNLARRVHTGVSAARANDFDRLIRDQRERFLEALLHADAGLLTLPAVVPGAVVFDA